MYSLDQVWYQLSYKKREKNEEKSSEQILDEMFQEMLKFMKSSKVYEGEEEVCFGIFRNDGAIKIQHEDSNCVDHGTALSLANNIKYSDFIRYCREKIVGYENFTIGRHKIKDCFQMYFIIKVDQVDPNENDGYPFISTRVVADDMPPGDDDYLWVEIEFYL